LELSNESTFLAGIDFCPNFFPIWVMGERRILPHLSTIDLERGQNIIRWTIWNVIIVAFLNCG
jgi:hypothetical protein